MDYEKVTQMLLHDVVYVIENYNDESYVGSEYIEASYREYVRLLATMTRYGAMTLEELKEMILIESENEHRKEIEEFILEVMQYNDRWNEKFKHLDS